VRFVSALGRLIPPRPENDPPSDSREPPDATPPWIEPVRKGLVAAWVLGTGTFARAAASSPFIGVGVGIAIGVDPNPRWGQAPLHVLRHPRPSSASGSVSVPESISREPPYATPPCRVPVSPTRRDRVGSTATAIPKYGSSGNGGPHVRRSVRCRGRAGKHGANPNPAHAQSRPAGYGVGTRKQSPGPRSHGRRDQAQERKRRTPHETPE
jgi:hypothetical protein